MNEEKEYRVPIKILTNRDPIIAGHFSILELVQWLFFGTLIYVCINLLPLPFQFNLSCGALILMFAAVFIHAPVNGLSGLEWIFIYLRFNLEKRQHHTAGVSVSQDLSMLKPKFQVKLQPGAVLTNYVEPEEEIDERTGSYQGKEI